MRVITWNVRRANKNRDDVWGHLSSLDPDIALLQEVGSIPESFASNYSIIQRKAYAGDGKSQKFSTSLMVKGSIDSPVHFSTPWEWVNEELQNFEGNIIPAEISLNSGKKYCVVSVYSPAWPIFDRERLNEIDATEIKLKNNPDMWLTEILWVALLSKAKDGSSWIVAGDLNASVTFDTMWSGGPRGNQEIMDRMASLGFTECLKHFRGMLTPTFRNPRDGKIVHQMDNPFVSDHMTTNLISCSTEDTNRIFGESLSDHLPIIADFQ